MDAKQTVIYDGECRFCTVRVDRWKHRAEKTEFIPIAEAVRRDSSLDKNALEQGLVLKTEMETLTGAHAVLALLAPQSAWYRILLKLYRSLPGFRWISEAAYRFIARHRRHLV